MDTEDWSKKSIEVGGVVVVMMMVVVVVDSGEVVIDMEG